MSAPMLTEDPMTLYAVTETDYPDHTSEYSYCVILRLWATEERALAHERSLKARHPSREYNTVPVLMGQEQMATLLEKME